MSNAAKRAEARRSYMQQRNPYQSQPAGPGNVGQPAPQYPNAGAEPYHAPSGYDGYADNLFEAADYGHAGQAYPGNADGYPPQYPGNADMYSAAAPADYPGGYFPDAGGYDYSGQAAEAGWDGYAPQYTGYGPAEAAGSAGQGYVDADGYGYADDNGYADYDDEDYDYDDDADYDYDEQVDGGDWDAYPSQSSGYAANEADFANMYSASAYHGYTGDYSNTSGYSRPGQAAAGNAYPAAAGYAGYNTSGSTGGRAAVAGRGHTGGYAGQAAYTGRIGGNTGILRDLPRPQTPRQRRKKGSTGQKVAITAIVLVLVVALVIMLVQPSFIFQNFGTPGSASTVSLASQSGSASQVAEQGYEKTAYALDAAALAGTLLAESGDAGAAYIQETLFIGDATIAALMDYSEATDVSLQNGIGVSGLSIADSTGTPCVDFVDMESQTIPQAVKIMQPQRIVLCFGVDSMGQSSEAFAQSYGALVDAILIEWPYADIIIAGVLPLTEYHDTAMTQMDQNNQALAQLAQQGGLKFMDWGQALREDETGFAEAQLMQADGQTVAFGGSQLLINYTRTHSHITDDLRPRPIDTSWERRDATATPPDESDASSEAPSSSSSSAASSSSSSSQQQATTVKVFVGAAANGGLTVNGEVVSSVTLNLAPGASTGSITAFGNPGHKFTGWKVSGGSLADTSSETIDYVVPQGATLGSSVSIVAQFEYVGVIVPKLLWYFLSDVAPGGYFEDWQVIVTAYPNDNNVPGTIISQTPEGGSTIASDSEKIIYVQVASQAVPDLSGQSLSGMTSFGFWPVTQVAQNSTLPAGSYISQSPAAGTTATGIATIVVYVSTGVAP